MPHAPAAQAPARPASLADNAWTQAGLFLLSVAVLGFAIWAVNYQWTSSIPVYPDARGAWAATMVIMIVTLVVIGLAVDRQPLGVLISSTNRMSLARLQTAAWTVLVLSALMAAVGQNLRAGAADPLAVNIPDHVWAMLGISAISLAGTPLVMAPKRRRAPDPAELHQTLAVKAHKSVNDVPEPVTEQSLTRANGRLVAVGQVAAHGHTAEASVADMFKGDETGNAAWVDMGKVQLFFFTLVAVLAYGFALGSALDVSSGREITTLPTVDAGFVWLLGVSHAGYLGHQAAPHSETADPTPA